MTQGKFNWDIDIVTKAEETIGRLRYNPKCRKTDEVFDVKYAQVRKILSSVVAIKNKLGVEQRKSKSFDKLPENIAMEVRFLKTTFLYQAGRDKDNKYPVKNFIEDSQLVEMVECIGTDVNKFELFCKYVEALVAFYKYRAVSVIAASNEAWSKNKQYSNQNYNQSNGNRR